MRSGTVRIVFMALVCVAALSDAVPAGLIWDEGLTGDLSGDRFNPNHFTLQEGANTLIATSSTGDREYVRMTIPSGLVFSALNHVTWAGIDQIGFIAIQAGTTFTEPPTSPNVKNLLGYTHFGPGSFTVGTDILPRMGNAAVAIGFEPPLPSGDYTFWIQQTGSNATTYRLDFILAPEPSCAALLGLFAATCVCIRRRRSGRA